MVPSMSDDRALSPWYGFILGALAGFACSAGFIGLVIGYSMSGAVIGGSPIAQQPTAPAAPTDPEPAAEAPAQPVKAVDPKTDHIRGNPNAKVTVIEYSDFECPFCKRHAPTMDQILAKYKDDVNYVFRHFPLSFHANAQKEAEGSECVAELGGNDAFWKFHDYVFEKTTSNGYGFALDQLPVAAKAAGVDEAKFKTCLDSGKYASKVQEQTDQGAAEGVSGTPGNFVINNKTKETKLISGAVPLSSFEATIDPMLK